MVYIKRKPVIYYPLPSLADVLQPVQPILPTDNASVSSPAPVAPIDKGAAPEAVLAEPVPVPPDGKTEEEQMDKLLLVFKGEFAGAQGNVGPGKGKKAGTRVLSHLPSANVGSPVNGKPNGNGVAHDVTPEGNEPAVSWRIWDRESYIIPSTGEIFTDYESFISRMTFLQQNMFQCEVSGKSNLTYLSAQGSEYKEARQLHTRFPRQLKKAVLMAVQFQIEGKLDTLADKIFERYVNRFFDDECVFVDVEGDKYLARIVKTFPPRSLAASTSSSPISKFTTPPRYHPFAAELNLSIEEANEKDDPMGYFYNVQLIEAEPIPGANGANGHEQPNGKANGEGEQWQGSTMEVQAGKISRDRINFSRVMLKRFIRDCVYRDAAVYSPWLVKAAVAERFEISIEMPESVRQSIQEHREAQMDKRKRVREERMMLDEVMPEDDGKPKTKKQKLAEEKRLREEERLAKESDTKKKPIKFPAEDLLVEYAPERDGPAGRIEVRPSPNKNLPYDDLFEKFLMSWSFLNVMGKPLALSPFSLDDYEQALYHNDPWTSPTRLMTEIHSTLLNALIVDRNAGNEAVKPLSLTGRIEENDTDYWEGKKGATTELLRPAAMDFADSWKVRELSAKENRKGWEGALVGCLWERATLETLPNYLDNILHLTFEDKPAPTRPTWSTGPATAASGHGLVPAKPEKRYSTLHHIHKLEIISFLIELVAQTASVRDFMEQSTAELTEVRKDIIEVRREQKALQSQKAALDPKAKAEDEPDANGDVVMDPIEVKEDHGTPVPSVNGIANGTASGGTERDELDSSPGRPESDSLSDPDAPEDGPNITAASRRKAMKEKAAEREAEEATRIARAAEDKIKTKESKHIASEKKRLFDEIEVLAHKLRMLDHDFRSHLYTLRARPLGVDRFGNKVWWMDGYGSAPLLGEGGKTAWGTGRLYLQGADGLEVDFCRIPAEMSEHDCEERRMKEEGGGRLNSGEWGMYDEPEVLSAFMSWLNPRGLRESALLKVLHQWMPELEGGMRKRRIAAGLDIDPDSPEEPVRRARPSRKVALAGGDDEGPGYLGWRNRRALQIIRMETTK